MSAVDRPSRTQAGPSVVRTIRLPEPGARIELLGGFRLWHRGRALQLPLSARRLLALLALEGGEATRSKLWATLWPESSEERASAALRTALWRLRRPGKDIVQASAEFLSLAPDTSVDVLELPALARTGGNAEPGALLPAFEGELLPGWYDDWVEVHRRRLTQLRLQALDSLSDALRARGRFGEAIQASMLAVQADPLRETAHLGLIRAHLAQGNRAEAMRAYRALRVLLESELGLGPSASVDEAIEPLAPSPTS